MVRLASLPLESLPQVANAWRSVHVGPSTQAFVVEGFWGVHLYRYSADVWMDGQRLRVEPGMAGFTPPGAEMAYRFEGVCTHAFAHLAWPAEAEPSANLPLLFQTGASFESLWSRLEEIIPWRGERRADVRVWDVLLELADIARRPTDELPDAVTRALAFIEARLGEPISAEEAAQAACVSHNHLCRLFRTHLGQTPMAAIRSRRVDRARHLLVHTTMPIKAIAAQVGLDDLQRFNKTIRLETGRSPRAIRERGPEPAQERPAGGEELRRNLRA